ncbi:hypothetical protein IF2G_10139 [Cordyceps javanica]|nr:hypothetical protein IF2G_10139 [Cordyceps javanica]
MCVFGKGQFKSWLVDVLVFIEIERMSPSDTKTVKGIGTLMKRSVDKMMTATGRPAR